MAIFFFFEIMTTLPDMDSLCLISYEITAGIPQRSGIASISLIGVCRSSAHRDIGMYRKIHGQL